MIFFGGFLEFFVVFRIFRPIRAQIYRFSETVMNVLRPESNKCITEKNREQSPHPGNRYTWLIKKEKKPVAILHLLPPSTFCCPLPATSAATLEKDGENK